MNYPTKLYKLVFLFILVAQKNTQTITSGKTGTATFGKTEAIALVISVVSSGWFSYNLNG